MKYLQITMPDKSVWRVPADVIVHNRTVYYAKPGEGKWDEEYNFAMNDDYEIEDWAANNMNWEEVKDKAIKIKSAPEPNYQEGWVNGKKEIVED